MQEHSNPERSHVLVEPPQELATPAVMRQTSRSYEQLPLGSAAIE
jgi:hypothetical protein